MNRKTAAALCLAASTGLLFACSDQAGGESTAKVQAAENTPVTSGSGAYDLSLGKTVFTETCLSCHKEGVRGAPALGDVDQWRTRIQQDTDTLVRHAIDGHGRMPPKGGFSELTDFQVGSAAYYVVTRSRDIIATIERGRQPLDCYPVQSPECEAAEMEDVMTLQMLWLLGGQGQRPLP